MFFFELPEDFENFKKIEYNDDENNRHNDTNLIYDWFNEWVNLATLQKGEKNNE